MSNMTKYLSFPSGEVMPFSVTRDESYLDADGDMEQLRYQINNNMVSSSFRIFILFPDETIDREIPRSDIKSGGSYSENYQNGQRRALSFTVYNESGEYTPNVNMLWAGTRLRLDMGVELADGRTIWCQKGIFVVTKATPKISPSGKEVQISANDKFALFEDATGKLESTYEIQVGSSAEDVIRDVLFQSMGNGSVLDPKPFILNSKFKGAKVESTITKNAGDTFGSILLDLATQMSAEVFYNAVGNLTFVPIGESSSDSNKPLIYEFDTRNGDISGLDFSLDYKGIVNRVIVVGNTSQGGVHKAVAVNDDPASPLCHQRIGYRTGSVINDSNIISDVLAEERAEYELRQQLILKSSTSASVPFNPLLEVNNLVAVSDDFFGLNHERFLVQSVSCSLDYGGQTNITFSNLRNLPFVVG